MALPQVHTAAIESGYVEGAQRVDSPNQDDRPGCAIDLVVIHGISLPPGEYGGPWIDALFTNCLDPDAHPYFRTIAHLRVSAHLLIRRDGTMAQYVPFHRRAWHAGVSEWQGRSQCNDYAIGIELEGTDSDPYTEAQYQQLVAVLRGVIGAYPGVTAERVVGHCDVAPDRKTDPGAAFDWERVRKAFE